MIRCVTVAAALMAFAATTLAQVQRNFPPNALRGELTVQQGTEVLLNGRPARLSPGSRIRGEQNLLTMSGAINGQKLLVHYTLDMHGLVHDVWILNAAEAARRPWPRTPEEAQRWAFDRVGQRWSRP